MKENIKFHHLQIWQNEDYLQLKEAVKGKNNRKDSDWRKLPSTFLLLFAILAAISFTTKEYGSFFLYLLGAIVCAIAAFYVHIIDHDAIFLYKLLFAKEIMTEINFYELFMEGHNDREVCMIYYDDIDMVYENTGILFLHLKSEERKYLFILKRNLSSSLEAFLKHQFSSHWQNCKDIPNFHL